ncbi:MAG: host attachment protein [Acidihalobacter sp.]|jgi:protein required for attachment to host cells
MEKIWVVAADHVRARVFEAHGALGELAENEDLVHPQGRMHANEMASDSPGVTHDRYGHGTHGMGHAVEPKEKEAIRFAREICDALERACAEGRFDRLYVAAEPRFLGNLRSCMAVEVRRRLAGEVSLELTRQAVEDIRLHLPEFL